jgi:hypothetical protein
VVIAGVWALAVLVVLFTGHFYILPYAAALGLALLLLPQAPAYRTHSQRSQFDALFVGYLCLVVIVRCRPFRWSTDVEFALNLVEHLAFAVVIGLMAFLILQLVFGMHLRRALVLGLVSFNLLGVGNELFQDWMGGDPLGVFDADAWKDIGANAAGSILLLALLWRRTSTSALV